MSSLGWNNNITAPTYFFRTEQKEDYEPTLPPNLEVWETKQGLPVVRKVK